MQRFNVSQNGNKNHKDNGFLPAERSEYEHSLGVKDAYFGGKCLKTNKDMKTYEKTSYTIYDAKEEKKYGRFKTRRTAENYKKTSFWVKNMPIMTTKQADRIITWKKRINAANGDKAEQYKIQS